MPKCTSASILLATESKPLWSFKFVPTPVKALLALNSILYLAALQVYANWRWFHGIKKMYLGYKWTFFFFFLYVARKASLKRSFQFSLLEDKFISMGKTAWFRIYLDFFFYLDLDLHDCADPCLTFSLYSETVKGKLWLISQNNTHWCTSHSFCFFSFFYNSISLPSSSSSSLSSFGSPPSPPNLCQQYVSMFIFGTKPQFLEEG